MMIYEYIGRLFLRFGNYFHETESDKDFVFYKHCINFGMPDKKNVSRHDRGGRRQTFFYRSLAARRLSEAGHALDFANI
eukprot:Pgem_evm1s18450